MKRSLSATPAELYSPSKRAFPSSLAKVRYPAGWGTRQVRGNGEIRLNGAHYFLTESLSGEVVGLQPQDNNQYRIYWKSRGSKARLTHKRLYPGRRAAAT